MDFEHRKRRNPWKMEAGIKITNMLRWLILETFRPDPNFRGSQGFPIGFHKENHGFPMEIHEFPCVFLLKTTDFLCFPIGNCDFTCSPKGNHGFPWRTHGKSWFSSVYLCFPWFAIVFLVKNNVPLVFP